ncbi:hypothetical protein DFJ73DRAFT_966964 [Zopfochytrium polystomum]|nr:hypothetical protein DFJ73DRAFT_966964 [Zopfochytrium polystomum]
MGGGNLLPAAAGQQPVLEYTSRDWLDFRVSLSGDSPDRAVLRAMHSALLYASPPLIVYAGYVCWLKVVQPRSWPFRRVDGRLTPRANELAVVAVLVFLVLRWLHMFILLFDVLPTSFALRELSNDIPFAVLSFLSSAFAASLALQSHHPADSAGPPPPRPPSAIAWWYTVSTVLALTGPLLALATGLAMDRFRNAPLAALLVQAHFAYWTAAAVVNISLVAVHGRRLRHQIRSSLTAAAAAAAAVPAGSSAAGSDTAATQALRLSARWVDTVLALHNGAGCGAMVTMFAYACGSPATDTLFSNKKKKRPHRKSIRIERTFRHSVVVGGGPPRSSFDRLRPAGSSSELSAATASSASSFSSSSSPSSGVGLARKERGQHRQQQQEARPPTAAAAVAPAAALAVQTTGAAGSAGRFRYPPLASATWRAVVAEEPAS